MEKSCTKRRLNINPPPPSWINLPLDITARILQKVGAIDILESAQKVCSTWRKASLDPFMWRTIDMHNEGDLHNMPYDLDKMCRHAVDRSQGQLVDINIEFFGDSDLLYYIAQRSNQLKRIRMVSCYGIDDTMFIEAVKKLPLLEELHFYMTYIPDDAIEELGRLRPRLKSFTYNCKGCRSPHPEYDDEEALAVAKSMPQVRHLSLFGNKMTNEGLLAILDGCRNLESLDLRWCTNLKLEGSLLQRCAQQIKYVRYPNDSTEDYEFIPSVEEDNRLMSLYNDNTDEENRLMSLYNDDSDEENRLMSLYNDDPDEENRLMSLYNYDSDEDW